MHSTRVVTDLMPPRVQLVHIWHETAGSPRNEELTHDPRYVVIENGANSNGT